MPRRDRRAGPRGGGGIDRNELDETIVELRALEGVVAIAAKSLDNAREYAQHRLRTMLESRGVALTTTSSWQLDSETGLVVETTVADAAVSS